MQSLGQERRRHVILTPTPPLPLSLRSKGREHLVSRPWGVAEESLGWERRRHVILTPTPPLPLSLRSKGREHLVSPAGVLLRRVSAGSGGGMSF
ncbi:MAG: hypothetical protein AMXMBFR61_18730 [Fimbriimonadales bacterium]